MMAKGLLVVFGGALSMGFIAMVVFMGVMMASRMGSGHMGMMGRGSDPSDETPVEGVSQVRLEGFAFVPASIVVDAGTTVTWTNYDSVAHTVTSNEGDTLKSGLFGENEVFSYTFDEPGEYSYYCDPHPNMKGLVRVREPAGAG